MRFLKLVPSICGCDVSLMRWYCLCVPTDPAFITGCYRSTPASKQDRPLFEEIGIIMLELAYLVYRLARGDDLTFFIE